MTDGKSANETLQCIECGTDIESRDVALYGQDDPEDADVPRFPAGEFVALDPNFDFEDGPYCSLPCGTAREHLADHETVETGEQLMESPVTGDTYRVTKWVEKGDGKVVALEKELITDE